MILSRTNIASAVSFTMALLMVLGVKYELTVADSEVVVNALVILVSAGSAVYFRYIAKTDLQTGGLLKPITKADEIAAKPPNVVIKD